MSAFDAVTLPSWLLTSVCCCFFFQQPRFYRQWLLRDGASLRVFTSAFISFSQLSRSRGLWTLKLLKLSCAFVVSSQNFQKWGKNPSSNLKLQWWILCYACHAFLEEHVTSLRMSAGEANVTLTLLIFVGSGGWNRHPDGWINKTIPQEITVGFTQSSMISVDG